jgi:predicted MFS family arabinose efflux permease
MIHELPGGKPQTAAPTMRDYLPQLGQVLRIDRPFRIMLIARIFTTFATLASPFYIGFATEQLGIANDVAVSNLLLMQTLGSVSGALIYSWLGSKRSLEFIHLSMFLGIVQPILALIAAATGALFLYIAFLGGGVAIGMLGMSFTNWVIDYATPDQRPVYSGLFNTLSASGFLIAPVIGGTLVEIMGYEAVFVASLCMMTIALLTALRFDPSQRTA